MRKLIANLVKPAFPILLALSFVAALANAETVDLSNSNPLNFRSGSDLYINFSAWNYAVHNSGSSPFPTYVGLQLLGVQPSSVPLMAVPHATNTYFGSQQIQGWLQNMDGTVSAPFTNPDAARLGLASGSLLVQPGVFGSASTPVALIEANAALTLSLSGQIFGSDIAHRGSSAVIHLRNLGDDLQIGLAGGFSLLNAISEPSISGSGSVQTSGYTQSVSITTVPEPGSFVLILLASGILMFCFAMRLRKTPAARE